VGIAQRLLEVGDHGVRLCHRAHDRRQWLYSVLEALDRDAQAVNGGGVVPRQRLGQRLVHALKTGQQSHVGEPPEGHGAASACARPALAPSAGGPSQPPQAQPEVLALEQPIAQGDQPGHLPVALFGPGGLHRADLGCYPVCLCQDPPGVLGQHVEVAHAPQGVV